MTQDRHYAPTKAPSRAPVIALVVAVIALGLGSLGVAGLAVGILLLQPNAAPPTVDTVIEPSLPPPIPAPPLDTPSHALPEPPPEAVPAQPGIATGPTDEAPGFANPGTPGPSPTPNIRVGNAQVRGSLDREVIRRVIRRHVSEVRACYERELAMRPELEGRVQVSFIISPTGSVQSATVGTSTLNNARVEGCVTGAVRRWTFPAPEGGGIVAVNYPFVFSTTGS